MKTTAIIMLGFLCLSLPSACKCEPDDEETPNPKESSSQNNEDSGKTDNDTVIIRH